jgi:hypothetical protein
MLKHKLKSICILRRPSLNRLLVTGGSRRRPLLVTGGIHRRPLLVTGGRRRRSLSLNRLLVTEGLRLRPLIVSMAVLVLRPPRLIMLVALPVLALRFVDGLLVIPAVTFVLVLDLSGFAVVPSVVGFAGASRLHVAAWILLEIFVETISALAALVLVGVASRAACCIAISADDRARGGGDSSRSSSKYEESAGRHRDNQKVQRICSSDVSCSGTCFLDGDEVHFSPKPTLLY